MSDHYKTSLSYKDKIDTLRLIRSDQVGPLTYHRLLARFGSAAAALDALPALSIRGGAAKAGRVFSIDQAERELETCAAGGVNVIAQGEPDYPPRLVHIEDAPPLLFARGCTELLRKKSVAVIGSRNASTNGLRFAEKISSDLGHNGLLITSGMARGIDAAAHRGGLETGTVAVMGGGVDVIYPRENAAIYDEIATNGVIISEMSVGTRPRATHFPRRNRIISGISRGIVVVEAAPRSGSLITARLALEQNREVFAVPGSAMDPRARGTNDLIRQGAILTEQASDVLDVINPGQLFQAPPPLLPIEADPIIPDTEPTPTDEVHGWLATRLGPTPVDIDDLAREFSSPAAMLSEALMELELAGRVERHPGNRISALVTI